MVSLHTLGSRGKPPATSTKTNFYSRGFVSIGTGMNHLGETAAQQRSIADSTVYLLLLNQALVRGI